MNVSKETIEKVLVRCKKQWVKLGIGAMTGALPTVKEFLSMLPAKPSAL